MSDKLMKVEAILAEVTDAYNLSVEQILGKGRERRMAEARKKAVKLCREKAGLSVIELCTLFDRDYHVILALLDEKEWL